jgi:hypothetical protein
MFSWSLTAEAISFLTPRYTKEAKGLAKNDLNFILTGVQK